MVIGGTALLITLGSLVLYRLMCAHDPEVDQARYDVSHRAVALEPVPELVRHYPELLHPGYRVLHDDPLLRELLVEPLLRLGFSLLSFQIIFLVALQPSSLVVLWLLNPMTQVATDSFALYLSLDLVAFAMISYVYRSRKSGGSPSQAWMATGYLALVILLVSNLALQ